MRLLYSALSPYARKARIIALEKGFGDQLFLEAVSLGSDLELLARFNPLGKIPVLVTDDGEALYDSPVICDYLDSLSAHPRLIPAEGPARWTALRVQALADGVMDAAVSLAGEARRPPEQRSAAWRERWMGAVSRGCAALDAEAVHWNEDLGDESLDIGRIAAISALGYVDLRLPDFDWRGGCSALAAWAARISQRPSVAETAPGKG